MPGRKLSRAQIESLWALWDLPPFEGLPSEDPQTWLTRIEQGCQALNIPVSQRMVTAIHFLRGPLKVVMKEAKGYLESHQPEKVTSCIEMWDEFKAVLKDLHARRVNKDEDYATIAAGNGLLIAGSSVVLPSLGILAVNAAGFTSAGVAAGSIAATIQSVVYGASTGGIFSVLQSIGASAIVAPPLALGLGVAAMGTGLACMLSGVGRSSNPGEAGTSDGSGGDDYNDNDFNNENDDQDS